VNKCKCGNEPYFGEKDDYLCFECINKIVSDILYKEPKPKPGKLTFREKSRQHGRY